MRTSECYLSGACHSKSQPLSLVFWQELKGKQRSGKALIAEKKRRLWGCLIGRRWCEEAVGGLTRSGIPSVASEGCVLGFLY